VPLLISRFHVVKLGRGWLDTGTHDALIDASDFVRLSQQRMRQLVLGKATSRLGERLFVHQLDRDVR
jgi:hypothetical protein